jgi:hypothetical protein
MSAAVRAPDSAAPEASVDVACATIPNINSATGLTTDYLNHFNEAIMVLEMITMMPECIPDLEAWRPKTYREHYAQSNLSHRDAIIAAYDNADCVAREALDSVAQTLNAVLSETRDVVLRNMATPDTAAVLALRAADWLKPLIARMAAVINGTATAPIGADTQSAIDEIFSQ